MDLITIIVFVIDIFLIFFSMFFAWFFSKYKKRKNRKEKKNDNIYNDIFLELKSAVGGINGEYESPSNTSTSTVLVKISV